MENANFDESNCSHWSNLNYTVAPTAEHRRLEIIYRSVVFVMVLVFMLAMGCGITVDDVRARVRRPLPALIGLACQFVVMPPVAFALARAFALPCHQAVGMVVVAACPGGALSNFFTYWSRGDLALSICMTAFSSVLAFGLMPMNLFIYLRGWIDPATSIPWLSVCLGIVIIWLPAALGILIRHKAPLKVSVWVTRIGSLFGLILVLSIGFIQKHLRPEFFELSWRPWLAACTLPAIGFVCGATVAAATCRSLPQTRAIAYETGFQNGGVAVAVISISFPGRATNFYIQFPLLFSIAQIFLGLLATGAHVLYYCIQERRRARTDALKTPAVSGIQDCADTAVDAEKVPANDLDSVTTGAGGAVKVPLDDLDSVSL